MPPLVRKTGLIDASRNTQINFKPSTIRKGAEDMVKNAYRNDVKAIKQQEDPYLAKLEDSMFNQTLTMADAGTKELYTQHSEDPKGFQENSYKQAKKFAETFDGDEDKQTEFLARYNISQKPYQAKVEMNFAKAEEKKYKNSQRMVMDSIGQSTEDNSILFYTKGEGYDDINSSINVAYNDRNATDSNDNPIYTKSQITKIEKAYDDRFFNGAKSFVDEKLFIDNNSIKNMKSELLSDKAGFMEKKNLNSKEANDLVKYIDTALKATELPKETKKVNKLKKLGMSEEQASQKRFDILQQGNVFEFSKGVVKNPDLDNIESVVAYRQEIKKFGDVLNDSEEKSALKETSNALYRMAQDEYGKDYERKDYWFKKDEVDNVGNITIPQIDERTEYEIDNNATIDFRAKVYEDTITKLFEKGLSLDNDNQDDIKKAREISNEVYVNNMRSRFSSASKYDDEALLNNTTFNQLMMDEDRMVLFPDGITLPRLRAKEEQPKKSKYTVEIIE